MIQGPYLSVYFRYHQIFLCGITIITVHVVSQNVTFLLSILLTHIKYISARETVHLL